MGSSGRCVIASPPEFKRLSVQDFKNPPEFIPKLINPFNTFAEQCVQTYDKQFDYSNFNGDLIELTFTTPNNYSSGANFNFNPITFNVTPRSPKKCEIGQIRISGQNQLLFGNKPVVFPVGGWVSTQNNQITVQYICGLEPSITYNIVFDVF